MHLTLDKILKLTQAACKSFDRGIDRYVSKSMLRDPWRKDLMVKVPRLAPPVHKLVESIRMVEAQLGVQSSEEGRVAFTPFKDLMLQLGMQDAGTKRMPPLTFFRNSGRELPVVVSFDATGYGSRTLNTVVVRNPYLSASNQQLRIFGLGNLSDDRDGTRRLLGPNLDVINATIRGQADGVCLPCEDGTVKPKVYVVTDVAALRHVEHISGSGWCSCSRDFALRVTPKEKPTTVSGLYTFLLQCHSPTMEERFIWSHNVLPGETLPRPCTLCDFAHDPSTAAKQLDDLLKEEEKLTKDETKAGKSRFCAWRMEHARAHNNVQPGAYGRPLFHHDMDDQLLDPLHYAELNMCKTIFKHGILNHASDDARAIMQKQLVEWKHPLDTRRKEDNRNSREKWFTGERWGSFCAGVRGSPGGPIAIATLMLIVADDMQQNGVGQEVEAEQATPASLGRGGHSGGRGGRTSASRGRGRTRAAFLARTAEETTLACTSR